MIPTFHFLSDDEQLLIKSLSTRYVVNGPRVFMKPPMHSLLKKRKGTTLPANEYCHIEDQLTGKIRMVEGPEFFFLGAFEEVVLRQESTPLKQDEYIEVINQSTGELRIIRGECSYKLRPHERFRGELKRAVHIDEHTGVIVRDLTYGELRLVTDKQAFFPSESEEVQEIVKKVLVEEHEVVALKDKEGKHHFRKGCAKNSSFFVPPYWEILNFYWSSGLNKDQRNLHIEKFDLRPKFMWYEFDVRTRDNVELSLNVTLFWQIEDVETLVRATDDASGDVCSHVRSRIIQKVSQVLFSDFLSSFNDLVHEAVLNELDGFYGERGLKIHSVEVREISCKDQKTQDVLSEIIQETTTRMNRIQKQISENEVSMTRIEGELLAEEGERQLLEKRLLRYEEEAQGEGQRQAHVVQAFIKGLGSELSLEQKLKVFETLRKKEMMESLAQENTRIFLTPDDVELKLDVQG